MTLNSVLSVLILVLIPVVVLVEGQATRTWVSGVGDDANPCSRTAPCKTFAGAISKTAVKGEIDVLDPGSFGVVTITKSISMDGKSGLASIVAPLTTGVVINAGATDTVIIRNVNLEGVGTGTIAINIISAGYVSLENMVINAFNQGVHLGVLGSPVNLHMSNVHIQTCTEGISLGQNGTASPTNLFASLNSVTVTECTYGVNVFSGTATIANSVIAFNSASGILVATDATANILKTQLENNGVGLDVETNATVVATANDFMANGVAVRCQSYLALEQDNVLGASLTFPTLCQRKQQFAGVRGENFKVFFFLDGLDFFSLPLKRKLLFFIA